MKRYIIAFFLLTVILLLTSCGQQEMYERPTATAIPTSTPTAEPTKEPERLSTANEVGDLVTFGEYSGEPLTWFILNKEGDRAQLLSQYVIETMKYSEYKDAHDDGKQGRWLYSLVREWLNGEFYDKSFTDDERDQIIVSSLVTNSLDESGQPTADSTEDKIFILTSEEAEALDERIRYGKATKHAVEAGVQVNSSGSARWWTRSIYRGSYVGYMGHEEKVNIFVPSYAGTGVRPVMWVKIKN